MPATKVKVKVNALARETQHLNVGDEVEFSAAKNCTVYFSDISVFGESEIEIAAGGSATLKVVSAGATSITALRSPSGIGTTGMGSPTEIVVP